MFLGLSVANGLVYVGNRDRKLYAFDQSTGTEKWSFGGAGLFWSAPAATDDAVYAGSDQTVFALDAQSGELLWSFEEKGEFGKRPLISGGVGVRQRQQPRVPARAAPSHALDAATGEELWVFETISTFLPAPALGEDIRYT